LRHSHEADVVRRGRDGGGSWAAHVLVNNAARGSHTRPEELTLAEWNGVIAVTLTGYFCSPANAATDAGRRSGAIVNIASIGGVSAIGRGNFAYDVSKAGVIADPRARGRVGGARRPRQCGRSLPGAHARPPAAARRRAFESEALMQRFLGGIPMAACGSRRCRRRRAVPAWGLMTLRYLARAALLVG